MTGDLDWGEAVDYILTERPALEEADVWAVVQELGEPPPRNAEALARQLLASTHPEIPWRTVKRILKEWRAYASLVAEDDLDD